MAFYKRSLQQEPSLGFRGLQRTWHSLRMWQLSHLGTSLLLGNLGNLELPAKKLFSQGQNQVPRGLPEFKTPSRGGPDSCHEFELVLQN